MSISDEYYEPIYNPIQKSTLKPRSPTILEVGIGSPYSENGGGVETYIHIIGKMFEERGFEVYYAYLSNNKQNKGITKKGDIVIGGKFTYIFPFIKRIVYNLELRKSIKSSNYRYDIIHINGDNGGLVKKIPGSILMTTLHGSWIETTKKTISFNKSPLRYYNLLYSLILGCIEIFAVKKSNIVIAVSNHLVDYFQHHRKKDDIRVIHSFSKEIEVLSDERRERIREDLGIEHNEIICLWVGRDPLRKALDTAVRSVLCTKGMKLLVVGANYESNNPRIISLGKVDEYRLNKIYNAADIFLFPSLAEGFSLAVIEAMSAGLVPIIVKGNPSEEIIENGINGLIADSQTDFCNILKNVEANHKTLQKIKENSKKTSLGIKKNFVEEMNEIIIKLKKFVETGLEKQNKEKGVKK